MAERITPRIDSLYRREIAGVIKALSRRSKCVAVMPENEQYCPNCIYDHQSQASSGTYNDTGPEPFTGRICPVCKGDGKIRDQRRLTLSANVQIGPSGTSNPTAGGDLRDGEALIKVLYRDKKVLEQAEYFLINGIRFTKVNSFAVPSGLRRYATAEVKVKVEE